MSTKHLYDKQLVSRKCKKQILFKHMHFSKDDIRTANKHKKCLKH